MPSLLDSLANPHTTPRQVAAAHNISLLTLSTLIARPDIQQHIANLESLAAAHARRIAIDQLPAAALALRTIINEYNNAPSSPSPTGGGGRGSTGPEGVTSEPLEAPDAHTPRRPSHTTACRAASLLFRIARFSGAPPRQRVARLSEPSVFPTSRTLRTHSVPDAPEAQARHTTHTTTPDEPEAPERASDDAMKTQGQQSLGPVAVRAEHQAPPMTPERIPPTLDTPSPVASPAPDPAPPLPSFSSVEDFLSHLEHLLASETPDNPVNIPEETLATLAALASAHHPGPGP